MNLQFVPEPGERLDDIAYLVMRSFNIKFAGEVPPSRLTVLVITRPV